MKLDDLISHLGEWLKGTGPHSGVVISSRIRLARNLGHHLFFHADKEKGSAVFNVLKPVLAAVPEKLGYQDGLLLDMGKVSELDRNFLLERHLISKEFLQDTEYKTLFLTHDETLSVMVNEEDHLRIQSIESGLNLMKAWERISAFDDEVGTRVEYAYSTTFGYLTACPTNTGTGMRGSVMLHLPALVLTKQINPILQAIFKIGIAARGFYGEGTEALGNFFQISNQITLGYKEEDILSNLESVVHQIVEQEQTARQNLYKNNKIILEDKIWRSCGLLKASYVITSKEAIELLSSVRLGVDLGFIKDIDTKRLNELFISLQPAHLQKWAGKRLGATDRDITRAQLIRETLTNK